MADAQAVEGLIDTAPLSPIRERTNTLEHALSKRPEPKDLLDRGILHAPPGVAAAVQLKQHGKGTLCSGSCKGALLISAFQNWRSL